MDKSYSKLIEIDGFLDRYKYLKLSGSVGTDTFGDERYLNQSLYKSAKWSRIRSEIIVRDYGLDMAFSGMPISGRIVVHHINPITISNVLSGSPCVYDPENLICVSVDTHLSIHYSDEKLLPQPYRPRSRGDTRLW